MSDDAKKSNQSVFLGLSGLRGIAALMVFLSHSSNSGLDIVPWFGFSGIGKMGVWLFFILSAYLLTYQLLTKSWSVWRDKNFWVHFFVGRFFRIWPLFIAVSLFAFWSTNSLWFEGSGLPTNMSYSELKETLLLQQGKGILWTIPVEFKFYVILPFLVCLIKWKLKAYPSAVVAFILLVVITLFLKSPVRLSGNSPLQFLAVFLTGSFLAVLVATPQYLAYLCRFQRLLVWGLFGAIILQALLMPQVYQKIFVFDRLPHPHELQGLNSLLWAIILLGVIVNQNGFITKILELRFLVFLGEISYSLYLVHYCVLKPIVAMNLNPFLAGWLALIISIVLSTLTYLSIEKPFIKLGKSVRARFC